MAELKLNEYKPKGVGRSIGLLSNLFDFERVVGEGIVDAILRFEANAKSGNILWVHGKSEPYQKSFKAHGLWRVDVVRSTLFGRWTHLVWTIDSLLPINKNIVSATAP